MKKRTRLILAYEDYEKAVAYWKLHDQVKRYNKQAKKQGAHPITMANFSPRTLKFWR